MLDKVYAGETAEGSFPGAVSPLPLLSSPIFSKDMAPMENNFSFNLDYTLRDRLLRIYPQWDRDDNDGIASFDPLDHARLVVLISLNFVDPHSCQNQSPRVQCFLEFLHKHPSARALGYAVSPQREDYRVSIDGLVIPPEGITDEALLDFIEFSVGADTVETP
jgi:hypothetical protein